jgi:hypothetical protein
MADYFAVKHAFYVNDDSWKDVASADKANSYWQLARNVAIAYPALMQHFNKIGNNPVNVLNSLHAFLAGNREPGWSYTSTKGQKQQQTDDISKQLNDFDTSTVAAFKQMNDIDSKTYALLCKCHSAEVLAELKDLQEQLK